MKDRIVEHPNRYLLEQVDATEGIVDLIPFPGYVAEPGTPLNKATLLSDETAAALGLTGNEDTSTDPTVNDAFASLNRSKAVVAQFTATIDTAWSENSSSGYYKTVPISGITATDTPVIDIVLGSDIAANQAILASWAYTSRITTGSNSITVYAYDNKPQVNLPVQIKAVR